MRLATYGSGDIVSGRLHRKGIWEATELRRLKRVLQPNDTFIDVGANLGVFTVYAALLGAHVIAVEPLQANRELLQANLCLNRIPSTQVTVQPVGLGPHRRDRGACHLVSGTHNRGDAVMHCASAGGKVRHHPGQAELRIERLDDILAATKAVRPRLLKLDVEGMELGAIEGASAAFAIAPPHEVIFECNHAMAVARGYDTASWQAWARNHSCVLEPQALSMPWWLLRFPPALPLLLRNCGGANWSMRCGLSPGRRFIEAWATLWLALLYVVAVGLGARWYVRRLCAR